MASSEMACVYAALILHDESISITVRLLLLTKVVTLLINIVHGCLIGTARYGHVLCNRAHASSRTRHAWGKHIPLLWF